MGGNAKNNNNANNGKNKNRDADKKDKGGERLKNKKNIVHIMEELLGDTVRNLGCELWNIEYYKEPAEWILEVTIEKEGGVSIDDCEKVHRAIDPVIDEADPIENSYSLVVSSPGLNRELKKDFHIDRYINSEVTVKLFAKHELLKEKSFRGTLLGYESGNLRIAAHTDDEKDEKTEEIVFEKKEIAHIYAYDEIKI